MYSLQGVDGSEVLRLQSQQCGVWRQVIEAVLNLASCQTGRRWWGPGATTATCTTVEDLGKLRGKQQLLVVVLFDGFQPGLKLCTVIVAHY